MNHAPGVGDMATAPLLSHLVELRDRLIRGVIALFLAFLACYYFSSEIFSFLVQPLADLMEGKDRRLIYTGLTETFFTYLKIALFGGFFIAFPFIAIQLYRFVAPGLYRNERRAFLPFLIATPLLFVAGAAFVYYLIMPVAWSFFLSFETTATAGSLPIQLEARVSEYLSLSMKLILAFGIFFQIPIVLTLLGRAGIISASLLVQKRKFAVVGMFVFAAILTPPDIISQIGLAVPGIILYEISILLVRRIEKSRSA